MPRWTCVHGDGDGALRHAGMALAADHDTDRTTYRSRSRHVLAKMVHTSTYVCMDIQNDLAQSAVD